MTLRKKLVALAVPAVLAAFAIPVTVAHAQASTPARIAGVHAFAPAAVPAKSVTSARITAAAETSDPAEADAAGGHADPSGSNVNHEFDGAE